MGENHSETIKKVFGSDSEGSEGSEDENGVRKSSRIKSILKKRKKDEFLEGAEESDFYPMTKIENSKSKINNSTNQSYHEHSSQFEDSIENRPLEWLMHHEKLLDLNKWVMKLSNGNKDISGWKYEVYYKQKDGNTRYGLLDAYFVSNKDKKMRTRREVAYYLNLNLSNKSELSREEVFKYAFQKNLKKMKVHRFKTYSPEQVEVKVITEEVVDDDATTISEATDLERQEMQFLSNEQMHNIVALQEAGKAKLKLDQAAKAASKVPKDSEESGTNGSVSSDPLLNQTLEIDNSKSYEVTLVNDDDDSEGYYRYFLNKSNKFLEKSAYITFDLQGKPIKGCDVTLKEDLVFDDTVLINLGHVLNEKAFHGPEFIYPVGFTSKCKFLSRKTFVDEVFYTNQIRENLKKCWKNGGKKKKCGPIFIVIDDIGNVFTGNSPLDVWKKVINSFMKAFNEKCRKIATVSELLYSNKKTAKKLTGDENVKRKVRHIITGMVTRICNKHQKFKQSGEDTFNEFDIDVEDFERNRKLAMTNKIEEVDSDDEVDESWWFCNVEYTLRGDLGNYLFGLDRLQVRSIVEGLPGVSVCCPKYIFIVQRDSYKKSFNVKATKKIASNTSRLQRGFAKIRKHLESVEKRAEVANKRFMRLEDDIRKRKPDKEFDDDNYKSFMQLVNKKLATGKNSKTVRKLTETEQKQHEALEKTKLMVTTISSLSRNLGTFANIKISKLVKDTTVLENTENTNILRALFAEQKAIEFYSSPTVNSGFLCVFNFLNLFGGFLQLCKDTPLSEDILQNLVEIQTDSVKEDIKKNQQFQNEEDSMLLEYRRKNISLRDSTFKKKKKAKVKKDAKDIEAKTEEGEEKEKEDEEIGIESPKKPDTKAEVEEEVEDDEDEAEAEGDQEDDEEDEDDDDSVVVIVEAKELDVTDTPSKPITKKMSKLILVESIPERPPIFIQELKHFFVSSNSHFFNPFIKQIIRLIYHDYQRVEEEGLDFGRKATQELNSLWDDDDYVFRKIPINEYTIDEALRLTLVVLLSPSKISLDDGSNVYFDTEASLTFPSLSYTNQIKRRVNIQQVKAKNFMISGRRGGKPKTLSERQLQEKERVQKYFEIRSLVSNAVDSRIIQINIPELGPSGSRTPKASSKYKRETARYDSDFDFLKQLTLYDEMSLPGWLYKLLTVKNVKDTRLLRMKKIISEANSLLIAEAEPYKGYKSRLQELAIASPVDLKREIYRVIEKYFNHCGIRNTKFTKEQKKNAILITKVLSCPELAAAFCTPVDAESFPDYTVSVKRPIDLQTVIKNFDADLYTSVEQYLIDMRLVWHNCWQYNPKKSDIYKAATEISTCFEHLLVFMFIKAKDKYITELDKINLAQQLQQFSSLLSKENIENLVERIEPTCIWESDMRPDFIDLVKVTSKPLEVVERKIEAKASIAADIQEEKEIQKEKANDIAQNKKNLDVLLETNESNLYPDYKFIGYIFNIYEGDTVTEAVCENFDGLNFTIVFPKTRTRREVGKKQFLDWINKCQGRVGLDVNGKPASMQNKDATERRTLESIKVQLLTKQFEELSENDRVLLLQYLCDKAVESTLFRNELDNRFNVLIQTKKKWRLNPPVVKYRHQNNHPCPPNSDFKKPWSQKYPGPLKNDSLTDEVSSKLSEINEQIWELTHDESLPLSRALETAYNRVERELARCYKKNKKKEEEKLWRIEVDSLLQRYLCKLKRLGQDRFYNNYFLFPNDSRTLLVQIVDKTIFDKASGEAWVKFEGRDEIASLCDKLSSQTVREGCLRFALKKRLTVFERRGIYEASLGETDKFLLSRIKLATKKGEEMKKASKNDAFKDLLWKCQSTFLLPDEMVEDHIDVCRKGLEKMSLDLESKRGRMMFSCKVVLLNIEKIFFKARKLKGNLRGWLDGKRLGWINFVIFASCFEEMRQALFFLEDKLEKERIEVSTWFEKCYGDCLGAIRCNSLSSVCCRIFAFDENLNYNSLGKKKFRKRPGNSSNNSNKRKKLI